MVMQENVAGPSRLRGGSAAGVPPSEEQSTGSNARQAEDQEDAERRSTTDSTAGESFQASASAPTKRRGSRPASPETELSSSHGEPPSPRPALHLDLATYPTAHLLRLLAGLLQQIATANDQLRPDAEEMEVDGQSPRHQQSTTREGTPSDSDRPPKPPTPSPTTALFSGSANASAASSRRNSQTTTTGGPLPPHTPQPLEAHLPLFSASKTSLNHPSSLLSFHARHVPSITIEAYLLRILKYCPTTNEVFLGLLVYFDRMSRLGTPAGVGGVNVGGVGGVGKGRGFAIDSYNVHRLVIAGVTVASKFFSDVFYTNSRYAKVGGLPPHELNQLELQFLLLNDFRLVIPAEEMQRYGDRLLEYWESNGDPSVADKPSNVVQPEAKDASRSSTGTAAGTTSTQASGGGASGSGSVSSTAPPIAQQESASGHTATPPAATSQNGTPPRGRERERAGSNSARAYSGASEIHAPTPVAAPRDGSLPSQWSAGRQSVASAEG